MVVSDPSFYGCEGFFSIEPPSRDNPEDPFGDSPAVTAEISLSLAGFTLCNNDDYGFGKIIIEPLTFSGSTPGSFQTASLKKIQTLCKPVL